MKKLVFLIAMLASLGLAAQAQAATWPSHCRTMKCVNKHLNLVHAQDKALQTQINSLGGNVPPGNALQAEIDGINQQLINQQDNVNQRLNEIWGQPALTGCWQSLAVSRFPDVASQPLGAYTQGWPYNDWAASGPTNQGLLDLAHADQPRNGFIYRLIFNACTSG